MRHQTFAYQQSRRRFLKRSFAALAAVSLPAVYDATSYAARIGRRPSQLKIVDIKRKTVRVEYREIPRRAMDRELPHWRYAELFQVELLSGTVGIGETLLYYTWGATQDDDVERAIGRNAADIMWDDSLGAGLQMALFEAVAKTGGVPVHRLLGNQVYDTTPLSWWNIDTPPEDLLAECLEAHSLGYTAYKTKGRPWYDVWKQVEMVGEKLDSSFKVDMDFNDTLLTADLGIPILKELDEYPQCDIYESPIPQGDIPGNARIVKEIRGKVAMHYGTPSPSDVAKSNCCDGFVIGGGASRLMKQAHTAASIDRPFWLQLVGTGVTAAWSLQFGAVLTHATWPAVNCHQLYMYNTLTEPIRVREGLAAVPTSEGIGYEIDWNLAEKLQVDKPESRPEPKRLLRTTWPDGRVMYTASNGTVNWMLNPARKPGNMPYFERGVDTRQLPDDGSARWTELYNLAQKGPTMVKE